jgi:hypothetical protein
MPLTRNPELNVIVLMKILVALQLLTSIAFGASEADTVLTNYYKAVAAQIGKDPRSLGGMDGVLKKYDELGQEFLLKNKDVLHRKAVADYLNLPALDFGALEEQERIVWKNASAFIDGDTVNVGAAKDDMDQTVLMFCEAGYGIPPFDQTVLATLWWDPQRAARTLRELILRRHLPPEDVERRKFVEQYSPPLVFRSGTNGEMPGIAFFDGKEIFAVELKHIDAGIYALAAIKWVRMK